MDKAWEINIFGRNSLKYEIKKYSKTFSKQISLESNKERKALEKKVKDFEQDTQNQDDNHK